MIWPFNRFFRANGVHRQLAVLDMSSEEIELEEVETKKEALLRENVNVTRRVGDVARRHMSKSKDVRKTVRDLLARIEEHDQSRRSSF